ncbi:PREDICTED: cingulin-like protein 1 isoform X1 [Populus euphratica]|uniref:Cingulin-like protein 1 isoform X1 n=2 Tax=Populus euphratica TaxID=75702 RepID=A0AAJ6UUU0_POPEU|nr:PREDICTED: cingulin-like protein 1 isoform X1 [Populus euphratica]
MQRLRSPPKHRHDGTSPLPLGMDWSPPPRKWSGRETIWPHDPRTGWSYCVAIPSWVVVPKSRDSDPVVFYRVQIGLQSPEGVTTTRGVLRRFNDFMKLFTDLKKAFPRKNLPPAPPKGLLRLKSRALLEERRYSLEQWMTKLLSDIDLSRSVSVASFLELEAAARSSFQDVNQQSSEASPSGDSSTSSLQIPPNLSSLATGSSIASDYGSDTAYETSDLGTPRLEIDENFGIGLGDLALDEDLTSPMEKLVKYGMSNIDEGLFMGQTILEQLEGLPRHRPHGVHIKNVTAKDVYNGNASKASFFPGNGMELFSEPGPAKAFGHVRKLSSESVGSDGSSLRGSELSNTGIPNSSGDGSLDLPGIAEVLSSAEVVGNAELQFSGDAHIVLPMDQHHKMNRVLLTMQRRLVTAKTDMEDLISRLNQEMAVKDYLTTKVKDLEVELETNKQKNKENMQQAILIERERLTQMQWDMEELRRKSLEMELKLKSKEGEQSSTEFQMASTYHEKDMVLEELDTTRKLLEDLSTRYEELEAKSKADIKFLAKEFKSLKNSQTTLKQELSQSLKEKSEVEKLLHEEREMKEHGKIARKKLLRDFMILCDQLQECNVNLLSEDDNFVVDFSLADALDLLTTSDDQIGHLLTEAQQLFEDDKITAADDNLRSTDDELRNMLANLFTDNAMLRKQVNSTMRRALKMGSISRSSNDVAPSSNNHVER